MRSQRPPMPPKGCSSYIDKAVGLASAVYVGGAITLLIIMTVLILYFFVI